jgi:hypothetical protein
MAKRKYLSEKGRKLLEEAVHRQVAKEMNIPYIPIEDMRTFNRVAKAYISGAPYDTIEA